MIPKKRIGLGLSHMGFCFKLHNTLWDFYLLRQCRQTLSPKNESSRFYLPGFPLVTCGNGCDNQDCDAHNKIPLPCKQSNPRVYGFALGYLQEHFYRRFPCTWRFSWKWSLSWTCPCAWQSTAPFPRWQTLNIKSQRQRTDWVHSCEECKILIAELVLGNIFKSLTFGIQ